MLIRTKHGWEIPESEETDERFAVSRRAFVAALGSAAVFACSKSAPSWTVDSTGRTLQSTIPKTAPPYPARKNARYALDRPLTEDPHIPFEALDGATDGLICLTAGGEGAIARLFADGQADKAGNYAGRLKALFPDRLYIEISRRRDAIEEASEAALIDLAYALGLPLVATNPAHYAEPSFHAAHDAMLCIANSTSIENGDRPTSSPDASSTRMPGNSCTYTSSSPGAGSSSAGRRRYRPRQVSATVRSGTSANATRNPSLNGRLDAT